MSVQCVDADLDGVCLPDDCDDSNPEVFYWQEFYLDEDHDGYGTGPVLETFCWGRGGYYIYPRDERSFNDNDCHDLDKDINPGKEEICGNLVDENCDGIICKDSDSSGSLRPFIALAQSLYTLLPPS